jgi:hypothetical protein
VFFVFVLLCGLDLGQYTPTQLALAPAVAQIVVRHIFNAVALKLINVIITHNAVIVEQINAKIK